MGRRLRALGSAATSCVSITRASRSAVLPRLSLTKTWRNETVGSAESLLSWAWK